MVHRHTESGIGAEEGGVGRLQARQVLTPPDISFRHPSGLIFLPRLDSNLLFKLAGLWFSRVPVVQILSISHLKCRRLDPTGVSVVDLLLYRSVPGDQVEIRISDVYRGSRFDQS